MVFLLVLIIIILIIITTKIKVKFTDLKINSQSKKYLNKNYKIEFIIYIFNLVPILKFEITNEKIQKMMSNEKIQKTIKKQKVNIIKNKQEIDRDIIKGLKNIKIEIEKINLEISIGTENALLTAFIIPIISTGLAVFLSKKIKKYNNMQKFLITPIYINQYLINIEFSGIFQIKMIHIINTICTLRKKRKGDKYERTSNRRTYDYGYE